MDWFLYDNGHRHERVTLNSAKILIIVVAKIIPISFSMSKIWLHVWKSVMRATNRISLKNNHSKPWAIFRINSISFRPGYLKVRNARRKNLQRYIFVNTKTSIILQEQVLMSLSKNRRFAMAFFVKVSSSIPYFLLPEYLEMYFIV